MEKLRCAVERITCQNEQNGYSVIKCRAKGYSDLVTVVGKKYLGSGLVKGMIYHGEHGWCFER